MLENVIVLWNLHKLTARSEGGMLSAIKESCLGPIQWNGYPCYAVNFLLEHKGLMKGRIIDFGHPLDIIEKHHAYPNRSLIVAYDFERAKKYGRLGILNCHAERLYHIPWGLNSAEFELGAFLPKEAVRLRETLKKYNEEHGFVHGQDSDIGFGNFLEQEDPELI